MGKRRFAVTARADQWKHDYSHYANRMTTHTRGWDVGIEIVASVDSENRDVFEVYQTGGSNNSGRPVLIGILTEGVGFEAELSGVTHLKVFDD